ncbi:MULTISPECIES: hypothetical protein [Vibrio]|uniref:hypothetical protein n=1 Tax=Vibrio TaxID=662 RepID=UPI0022CD2F3B|nr:hypothetical protein [Vibrio sp. T11.5]MDA0118301.1 hypothetical protein [Vibrio sp. T11.5]
MKKIECQQMAVLNDQELEMVSGGSWSDRLNRAVSRALGGGRWSRGCGAGARDAQRGRRSGGSSGRRDNGRDRRDRRN